MSPFKVKNSCLIYLFVSSLSVSLFHNFLSTFLQDAMSDKQVESMDMGRNALKTDFFFIKSNTNNDHFARYNNKIIHWNWFLMILRGSIHKVWIQHGLHRNWNHVKWIESHDNDSKNGRWSVQPLEVWIQTSVSSLHRAIFGFKSIQIKNQNISFMKIFTFATSKESNQWWIATC